jgi:hypothetical protein
MRWLVIVGVFLIVFGIGGSMGACYQSMTNERAGIDQPGPDGGVPSQQDDSPSAAPMLLAVLSGLALAGGLVMVGVGMGRWRRPAPSSTRPANPWNEQPGDKGDPPTGLV